MAAVNYTGLVRSCQLQRPSSAPVEVPTERFGIAACRVFDRRLERRSRIRYNGRSTYQSRAPCHVWAKRNVAEGERASSLASADSLEKLFSSSRSSSSSATSSPSHLSTPVAPSAADNDAIGRMSTGLAHSDSSSGRHLPSPAPGTTTRTAQPSSTTTHHGAAVPQARGTSLKRSGNKRRSGASDRSTRSPVSTSSSTASLVSEWKSEQISNDASAAPPSSEDVWVWMPKFLRSAFKKIPPRVRGLLTCNLLVLLVATNWVVVKEAGEVFDPFLFAAMRFGVAALALSPFIFKALKRPETLKAGIELGCYTAAGYLAQSQGLITTDASRASFLSTFTVIVVPLLAGLNGRGVKPMTWVAAMTALAGVFLLEQSGAPPCAGDVWSIISAIAFGVQIFRTEHWTRVLGHHQGLMLMSVVLATTAASASVAAGFSHAEGLWHLVQGMSGISLHLSMDDVRGLLSSKVMLEVLYTSLLTTDVALLMELMALHDISSTEAAIIYTLEPVLGAAFAFAVFGERWSASGWVGAAMIVASCLGMQFLPAEES